MRAQQRKLILIVDDDRQLTGMLSELLETEGYECLVAPNGARALLLVSERKPDLVVLDVMMPGDDGVTVLRTLRHSSDVPVIMLTALGENDDRVRGLEAGADDYLAKPFDPRELLLRIRVILKRTAQDAGRVHGNGPLTVGPLEAELEKQRAQVGEVRLALTDTELRILWALMEQAGKVVSRRYLNHYAIGRELLPQDRTLDTHISNLRRKIAGTGVTRCAIRTVRGSGYRLVVE